MELGIKKFFNSHTYDDPSSGSNGLIENDNEQLKVIPGSIR
jgi:hypothetical protein